MYRDKILKDIKEALEYTNPPNGITDAKFLANLMETNRGEGTIERLREEIDSLKGILAVILINSIRKGHMTIDEVTDIIYYA